MMFLGTLLTIWSAAQFVQCEGTTVFVYLWRVAGVLRARATHGARRAPGQARAILCLALAFFVGWLVNAVMVKGVGAAPTQGSVAVARGMLEMAPLPAPARSLVVSRCVQHHNVAFLGNFLHADVASELACDLGVEADDLALWDSGAAINASVGKYPILPGSVKPNATYVSTANGLCLPPTKCTQLLLSSETVRGSGTPRPSIKELDTLIDSW